MKRERNTEEDRKEEEQVYRRVRMENRELQGVTGGCSLNMTQMRGEETSINDEQ